jgi:hypothetical protein
MPLTRFLVVVMLVAWCAGQLCAQSQGNGNSGVAPSQATASNASSSNPVADLFQRDPNLQAWFPTQGGLETNAVGGNRADVYAHPSAKDVFRIRVGPNQFPTEWQAPFDATCYAIRSYLVVRESPHSDVTHRDGSTTCVPAARVRMYSTTDQKR